VICSHVSLRRCFKSRIRCGVCIGLQILYHIQLGLGLKCEMITYFDRYKYQRFFHEHGIMLELSHLHCIYLKANKVSKNKRTSTVEKAHDFYNYFAFYC